MANAEVMIPTARGDAVSASDLGLVLPTELIIQETAELAINWPDNSWAARPEEERIADVVAILNNAHAAGVGAILDRTIVGIARNIPRMKKIALQTKLNILVCTGIYVLYELPYYFHYRERWPERFSGQPSLADFMVRDIEHGVLDTGVRAAAIKVVSDRYGIEETPDVRLTFRATSEAHRRTGAPIVTHIHHIDDVHRQQQVFADEGVDLSRVVIAHLDRTTPDVPLEEFERALDRGSYLSFDMWEPQGENPVVSDPAGRDINLKRVASLVRKGYKKQILLSSGWPIAFEDCFPDDFVADEGIEPFMSLIKQVIPGLKALGISDSDIHDMTRTNPQQMLSTVGKGGY